MAQHTRQQRRSARASSTSKPAQATQEATKAPDAFAAPESRAERASDSAYPPFESDETAPTLFPKRQPGAFPDVRPVTTVSRALTAISEALPGDLRLDVPAVPVAEGEVYDPLRDGPLRYCGYANECGEAFAAWLPIWGVPFSYAVAVAYVLVDTYDKGHLAYLQAGVELKDAAAQQSELSLSRLVQLLSFERSLDTVVWQLLASVICPGYTIHSVVYIVHSLLGLAEKQESVHRSILQAATAVNMEPELVQTLLDKSIPTFVGLAAIPFIVHPIDNAIHGLMNLTLRPAMRKYVCGPGQGTLADLQMCKEECDASNVNI